MIFVVLFVLLKFSAMDMCESSNHKDNISSLCVRACALCALKDCALFHVEVPGRKLFLAAMLTTAFSTVSCLSEKRAETRPRGEVAVRVTGPLKGERGAERGERHGGGGDEQFLSFLVLL